MDVKIENVHTYWNKNCYTIRPMGQNSEVNLNSNEFLAKSLDENIRETILGSPIVNFCTVQLYDDFGNTFSSCKNDSSIQFLS